MVASTLIQGQKLLNSRHANRARAPHEYQVSENMSDEAAGAAITSRDAGTAGTRAGPSAAKAAVYASLSRALRELIADQTDFLANISNFAALLFSTLPNLNWVGFYLLRGSDLVLGPFQGKPACACIAMGDGVCGTAALQRAAVLVPNVHAFPGHIVCDEASQSEMVLPVFKVNRLIGVLDLDSPHLARFDDSDREHIEALLRILMDGTEVPEFRLAPPE
jgi:L-methionine (R)-S-oxide reductase